MLSRVPRYVDVSLSSDAQIAYGLIKVQVQWRVLLITWEAAILLRKNLPREAFAGISHNLWIVDGTIVPIFRADEQSQA